jgi:hypothetical protein
LQDARVGERNKDYANAIGTSNIRAKVVVRESKRFARPVDAKRTHGEKLYVISMRQKCGLVAYFAKFLNAEIKDGQVDYVRSTLGILEVVKKSRQKFARPLDAKSTPGEKLYVINMRKRCGPRA